MSGREFTPLECCGTVKKEFFLNLFQAAKVHREMRRHYIMIKKFNHDNSYSH